MRLDKFLSNLKYGTRSEMTKVIKSGIIKVNNKVIINSHYKIDPKVDQVFYNDELVIYREIINLALYKPVGYLSANKDNLHSVVISLIKEPYNRFDFKIAGRLDLDSEGLLILTTSGRFVNDIINPNKNVEKVYIVKTDLDSNNYLKLLDGVIIKDGNNEEFLAKAIDIKKIEEKTFEITISEGKFHQVKRMFKAINLEVINLKRVQVGKLKLGNLKPGEYKEFDKEDII